jgi:lysophospholipase L1-like esterase
MSFAFITGRILALALAAGASDPMPDPESVSASLPEDHPRGEPRSFQPIEDPKGSMRAFYEALGRTDSDTPGALTRVVHMGDSSIGLDGLPHAIRSRMQDRFGDGGAGFVLLDRYSKNYKNKAAAIRSAVGWDVCYIAYLCKKDGHYGLGGHVFRGRRGASSTISTLKEGGYGTDVSRFEVWYAAQPGGSELAVRVDGGEPKIIDTAADALEDRWEELDVEPGAHSITVESRGSGFLRAYGVVLETDGPGVVWDSLSMIGAFTKRLHGYDPTHIAVQIAHRDPHLLVLNYGGNDLRRIVTKAVTGEEYVEELRKVLSTLRTGKPSMSCLVVGVIDHGRSGSQTVEARHVDTMIEAQRKAAHAEGCAFFDTVAAMGGPGSLAKWRKRSPPLAEPDLKHLNHRGRELMGELLFKALVAGFESHRRSG